jgi:hypothetical protein
LLKNEETSMRFDIRVAVGTMALIVAAGSSLAAAGQTSAGYVFEEIVVPGQLVTQPRGINSSGKIVGTYGATQASAHALEPLHGFLLDKGVFSWSDL